VNVEPTTAVSTTISVPLWVREAYKAWAQQENLFFSVHTSRALETYLRQHCPRHILATHDPARPVAVTAPVDGLLLEEDESWG
jgi:hypothetical protein